MTISVFDYFRPFLKFDYNKLNYNALLLFAICINFPQKIVILALAIWLLSFLPTLRFKIERSDYKSISTPFALLFCLLIVRVSSSFYHVDTFELVTKQLIDTQAPLVLLPLLLFFGINKSVNIDKVILFYIIGGVCSCLTVFAMFILYKYNIIENNAHIPYPITNNNISFTEQLLIFQDFFTTSFKHRAGMGANLTMAFACLIYYTNQKTSPKIQKKYVFLFGTILVLTLCASGSRSGLLSFLLVILFSVLYHFRKNLKLAIPILVVLAIALTGYSKINTCRPMLTKEISSLDYSKIRNTDPRFKIWESAIELVKFAPIIGYGQAGYEKALLKQYEKYGLKEDIRTKNKSHNQFIQFSLESGVLAGVLFVLILLSIYTKNNFAYLSIAFIITFAIYSFFEDSLVIINGVSFLSFFIAIFFINSTVNNRTHTIKIINQ